MLALATSACAAEPEQVSVRLQWKHQFEFAGFYAAREKGYYRDVGLDVTLHEYSPDVGQIDEVMSGRTQFGVWGAQLISERLRGTRIQLVANYFKRSPLVILTHPSIRLPSDLRGRRLMVPPADIDTVSYQTMFRQFGLRTDEITIVPHSFGIAEFADGRVDAMSAYVTDQPYALRAAGVAFNVLDPGNYGAELYDVIVFTSEDYARAHADTVRRFRQASDRGWAYALEHQEEIVDLIRTRYDTQQRARDWLLFEARETEKVMLPRVYPIGSIDVDKLRRMAELYVQLGEAESLAALDGFVFDAERSTAALPAAPFELTEEERAFVQAHPVIRVGNERDAPPFDFHENGVAQGYAVALLRLAADRIGVELEFVQGDGREQLLERFCARDIDLLQPVARSAEVERCGLYTPAIVRETVQFLTRKDRTVASFADLHGAVVALPPAWARNTALRRPRDDALRIVETADVRAAIDAVRAGRADAALDFGSSLHYHVNRAGHADVVVQGAAELAGDGGALHVATRRDWQVFHGLLVRALAAVGAAEKRQLQALWLDPASSRFALELTDDERAFLRAHPVLRASNETDYPPYDYAVGGQPRGYSVELLNLLARRAGFSVEYVTGPTWDELVDRFRRRELDVLHSLYRSQARESFGLFTKPYARTRSVFVTRHDDPDVTSFEQLEGRTVAVGRGWAQQGWIAEHHPGIRMLEVDSLEQMLDAVSRGDADATVEGEPSVRYWLAQKGLTDLKIAGWARELEVSLMGSHHFMVQRDAPQLASILDKAMASLTPAELQELQQQWLYPAVDASPANVRAALTPQESAYLGRKGVLTLCADPDSLPYEKIDADGRLQGITADVAQLIGERIGVQFRVHRTARWSESLAALRERRCDLMLAATDLPSRRDAFDFTRPYLVEPLVVATRATEVFVKDAAAIGARPVGVIEGYSYAEALRARHPDMHIVPVDDIEDGLRRVQDGSLWGYIGTAPTVAYALAQQRMLELKIAGRLDMDDGLSVASRNDEPLLSSIMQKAVDSIGEDERRAIVNRWVSVRYEQGFDYALFWKIGAGVLALLLAFYAWNRKLARMNAVVQRARAQTQGALDQVATLLDNSGQGFLAFGRDLCVEPAHSRECARIFDRPLPGASLPDLLCAGDAERRRLLAKTLPLAMDAQDALQRDAFVALLPHEYVLGERSYKADYRRLQHQRMMLVLTDITAEKRLREKLAAERQRLEFIVHALEDRVDVLGVLRDFDAFRSRVLPDLLSFERDPKTLLSEIYRHVHTFKSLFAQIGLPTLPERLHALENRFAALRGADAGYDAADVKRELGAIDLGAALERDLAVLRDALGDGYFSAERELRIPASTIAALEREAAELYGADSRMLQLIHRLGYEPLQALLAPACKAAEQLARRQGKRLAPIVCDGEPAPVDPVLYAPFCKTLVHVFRNAVDHGIEDADTRLLADKDETAAIRCSVRTSGARLHVSIADDGGGLDPARIRRKALALGLLDAAQAEAMADADVLHLIFAEGFSTRDAVDAVSGRGIGLAAVAQELQKLGGAVRIESMLGAGTRFSFELPYAAAPALPSSTPLQRTARLLAPLPKVMDAFCRTHLELPVDLDAEMREFTADTLRDFTALVPLGGDLDAVLGISIDRPLLLEMTRRFERAFAEHEIAQYADSVGAEIANTIVGNATVYFTPFARTVAMGTPEVIGCDERAAKFGRRAFRGYAGRGDAGSFILFCKLTEERA